MPRNPHGKRCRATRRDGEPCTQWAVRDTDVCKMHGGLAPQVKAKAAERRTERQVMKMVEQGLLEHRGEHLHPIEHMLEELYLSANIVAVLGGMVGELTDITQFGESGRDQHVLYRMWSEERDRHAKLAAMALKAGVAERQVQLAERQAELIAGAVRNILMDLGVGDDPRAPQIVRARLMELAAA